MALLSIFKNIQLQTPSDPPSPADSPNSLDVDSLKQSAFSYGQQALEWVNAELLHTSTLIQFATILGVLVLGIILSPLVKNWISAGLSKLPENVSRNISGPILQIVRPLLWLAGLFIALPTLEGMGYPTSFVRLASSLALAWVIIRTATYIVPAEYRQATTWIAWGVAGLNAFGLLLPTLNWLDNNGFSFGDRLITLPFIFRAILFSALFLYGANWLSKRLRARIDTLPRVEPSIRALISNATHVGLFFAAVVLALSSLQIPLGGLAVLGGALGVGIGFGMQQIVANFISGIILLTDRSIKPDDVIEVDDTYGVVKSLGLRYASVVTRDGKEHLIPNEGLVTNKVVNWSYSDNRVRIKRRLRVEYETDLRTATDLVVQGAKKIDRVLKDPAPTCLVMEFGDEAVEIECRFWINDPQNGINNVGSAVMMSVWDLFKENGIDIPLRQEEILIQPGSVLEVKMAKE
ncbi:mechanosensitive ion channel family protein [Hirschia baltica]|uniref:mechanosensitive ion channel family protein n=1 Tax=Hirschia baltica TaxID=2724 RepID=UPI0002D9F991|nr:mechanosensitive ion channel domain-containing protein [Hirschia baltica]